MITVLTILAAVTTLSQAAPRYGEDGGYIGYASYKPLTANSVGEKRPSGLSRKQREKKYEEPISLADKSEDHTDDDYYFSTLTPTVHNTDSYHVPKDYDSIKYEPGYHRGYRGNNDLLSGSPTAPFRHSALYGAKKGGYKIADTYAGDYSSSNEYEKDYHDVPIPYEYGYLIKDHYGNEQYKKEVSDGHGKVQGSYGFTDEHGRYREVEYVADKGGFRANIKTNEPGTKSEDPADVSVDSAESGH